jgi:hypothetical protein
MDASDDRYFFVHVMKTAGFSLVRMIKSELFDKSLVYPTAEDGNALEASMNYDRVRALTPDRLSRIKVFSGHFPFAAMAHMGPNVRTFSLFRDPVARTISHLKHTVQRLPHFRDWTLDAVYRDPEMFQAFYDNLQLRFFAVRDIDTGRTLFEHRPLTRDDVDYALDNVRRLDILGLTEEFDVALGMLQERFGWSFARSVRINQTEAVDLPAGLEERIAEDLELDRVFYEGVLREYAERKRAYLGRAPGASAAVP